MEDVKKPASHSRSASSSASIEGREFESEVEAADVELRLDRHMDEIPEGPEREKFKELFIDDVARALGIPREMIQVTGFESGSIIVKFTIVPQQNAHADDQGPSPMDLARRLEQQLNAERSVLKDGIVTGTAIGVNSQPSSRASSRQHSARGNRPHQFINGGKYDAQSAQAVAQNKPIGLREELRLAREARKLRDGPSDEEKAAMRLKDIEARAVKKLAEEQEAEQKVNPLCLTFDSSFPTSLSGCKEFGGDFGESCKELAEMHEASGRSFLSSQSRPPLFLFLALT